MTNRFKSIAVPKSVKFMGQDIDIFKLNVNHVTIIQELAANAKDDQAANLKLLLTVIQFGAKELAELSEEELHEFPMDDLSTLSNNIMKYSGLTK